MEGQFALNKHTTSCLEALVESNQFIEKMDYSNFPVLMERVKHLEQIYQLTIVGSRYRTGVEQSVLRSKNKGTMVLLMREPANPNDPNAIACLVSKGNSDGNGFNWFHVGYLPAQTSKSLAPIWPTYAGIPAIVHATLMVNPRIESNLALSITASNKLRDVSNLFN